MLYCSTSRSYRHRIELENETFRRLGRAYRIRAPVAPRLTEDEDRTPYRVSYEDLKVVYLEFAVGLRLMVLAGGGFSRQRSGDVDAQLGFAGGATMGFSRRIYWICVHKAPYSREEIS